MTMADYADHDVVEGNLESQCVDMMTEIINLSTRFDNGNFEN
jgi:hypothetical protein